PPAVVGLRCPGPRGDLPRLSGLLPLRRAAAGPVARRVASRPAQELVGVWLACIRCPCLILPSAGWTGPRSAQRCAGEWLDRLLSRLAPVLDRARVGGE